MRCAIIALTSLLPLLTSAVSPATPAEPASFVPDYNVFNYTQCNPLGVGQPYPQGANPPPLAPGYGVQHDCTACSDCGALYGPNLNSFTATNINDYYHSVCGNYAGTYPVNPIYCVPPEWTTVVTPGFTPGSVGMHITQMVRGLGSATVYNATGFVANSLDYQVQVRLFDSATVPKLIGNSAIMPLVNNWTSVVSNLPLTWDVEVFPDAGKNTPATDNYPLTMWYGGQGFITAQPVGLDYTVCSIGGYESGIRQIDCRFEANT